MYNVLAQKRSVCQETRNKNLVIPKTFPAMKYAEVTSRTRRILRFTNRSLSEIENANLPSYNSFSRSQVGCVRCSCGQLVGGDIATVGDIYRRIKKMTIFRCKTPFKNPCPNMFSFEKVASEGN